MNVEFSKNKKENKKDKKDMFPHIAWKSVHFGT